MELRTLSGLMSYVIWNGVFFQRNQLHIYLLLAPDASSRCHDKQVAVLMDHFSGTVQSHGLCFDVNLSEFNDRNTLVSDCQ